MSIDASALTSINNAIASYSSTNTSSTSTTSTEDYLSTISNASAEVGQESRYKQAFEEKLKTATGEDEVEISDEAIKALQQYNLTGKVSSDDSSSESSTSTATATSDPSYTYDYVTMKKQREENLAAIEKEVVNKYGSATEDTEETEESEDTENTEELPSAPNLAGEPPREAPPLGMPPMHGMPPPEENAQSLTDPQGVDSSSEESSSENSSQTDTTISGADEMSESVSLTDA